MAKGSESIFDRTWKFFTSLRLAIPILIIVASTSIIGTVIEQNQSIEVYRKFYSDTTIRLLSKLGFFDMYHSWWFLLLLVLFIINLTCCTIDRIPNVMRIIRNPKRQLDETLEKSLSLSHRWKVKGDIGSVRTKYLQKLEKSFSKPVNSSESETEHLYAERGPYSRFGVYITHLSILVILVGTIIGNVWGFKGFVNIVEGSQVTSVPTRGGKGRVDLGFTVRCNKFWIETYPNGQPKEYFSDLSILDGEKEIMSERIEVNSPLRYKGIWFYQASYGPAGASNITVDVMKSDGSVLSRVALKPDRGTIVKGLGTITALDYSADYQGFGPALMVSLEGEKVQPVKFWVFKNYPDFDKRRGAPHYLSFTGIDTIYYTGLQVARDPGVNVVWLGCALMVLGLLVAFFGSHRRVWLRISPAGDGRFELVLAGSANKNRLAFEKTFSRIKEEITSE